MSSITLRAATTDDLTHIVDLSTAAFDPSSDAIVAALFPPHLRVSGGHNSESVRELRIARKAFRFNTPRNVMMIAADDTLGGKIVGYACWERPAEEGAAAAQEGPRPPKMDHPELDRAALGVFIQAMEQDAQKSYGEKGTQNVWCLDSLGVHPNHQKRGIGKLLLNWGVQQAKTDGKEVYLVSTPAGVALYRSAGFEDVRIVDIFNAPFVSMKKLPSSS